VSRFTKTLYWVARVAAATFGVFRAAASTGEIAQAKYEFTITPQVGGQNAPFIPTFVAPRSTVKGDFYDTSLMALDGAYRSLAAPATGGVKAGRRVTLQLNPTKPDVVMSDVNENTLRQTEWCPGVYTGYVEYCTCRDAGETDFLRPNTYIGHGAFTVVKRWWLTIQTKLAVVGSAASAGAAAGQESTLVGCEARRGPAKPCALGGRSPTHVLTRPASGRGPGRHRKGQRPPCRSQSRIVTTSGGGGIRTHGPG
jgi:hypothetical protein